MKHVNCGHTNTATEQKSDVKSWETCVTTMRMAPACDDSNKRAGGCRKQYRRQPTSWSITTGKLVKAKEIVKRETQKSP